jgi:hypothetical protein
MGHFLSPVGAFAFVDAGSPGDSGAFQCSGDQSLVVLFAVALSALAFHDIELLSGAFE